MPGVIDRVRSFFFDDRRPIIGGTGGSDYQFFRTAQEDGPDFEDMPGYEDLVNLRRAQMDYISWLESSYVQEMMRRKAYFETNQVQSDAGALQDLKGDYISPSDWNDAHSGPGWEDVRAMLPDATEETVVKMVPTNYVEVIIRNRQVVYDTPPVSREILKAEVLQEKDTKNLEMIYAACSHDLVSKKLCHWTGLFATSFQVISYDTDNERLVKTNVEPHRVRVIAPTGVNDLQHFDVVVSIAQDIDELGDLTGIQNEEVRAVWQVWWRDMWWYEAVEGKPCLDIDCTQPGWHQNPFRDNRDRPVKPILVTHDDPTVTKIHEPGTDILIHQNQIIDRMYTGNGHAQEYQNFAVPVITGADLEEVEGQPYSPAAPQVYRSDLTKFSFEHPAAPIGEALGATTRTTRTFARLQSIDPEIVDPETKVQSGVSRAQARTALVERRNQEFPKWQPYERESYWLSAIVWNTFNPEEQLPPCDRALRPGEDSIQILVQFGEDDLSLDALSESVIIGQDLDNDLIRQEEVIAARRRIPLARAEKILVKNIEENKKNRFKEKTLFDEATPRIGQSGNRPTNPDREKSKTGGNTTSATGNVSIGG